MKKLLIAAIAVATSSAWAQTFEGTIKWSMKMEVTDPAMKAKMAEGQPKMNDPAQQAKMKEMQEKMNDPQFKAIMEANPAMKAQMEKVMKMSQGGGGDMMSNMMPKGMTIKIKDGKSLMTMDGGMMAGDILNTPEKRVHLDRENKTYSVMPAGNNMGGASEAKLVVTKTSETMKILGYNCTKKMDRGQSMFYEGMDGMTLRIESTMKEGSMVMEVTEIKHESLNAADFTIPSDYKETQGMFGRN